MKRNELFKSLMNVQSQVTSLMNVVLQEANDGAVGVIAGSNGVGAVSNIVGDIVGTANKDTVDKVMAQFTKNNEIRDNAIKDGFKDIDKSIEKAQRDGKLKKENLVKVENLVHKMRIDAIKNADKIKDTCKYVGIALLAVSCIFGYLMYPSLKENFISAFNSGNPAFERFGSLIKAVAGTSILVFLLALGIFLSYVGFRSKPIDMTDKGVTTALRIVAKIRVEFDNLVTKLKTNSSKGISDQIPAWQW